MRLIYTFLMIMLNLSLFGQYTETFGVDGKGILSPGCTGMTLATCSNTDFAGVEWTIEGDLSGIDSEGFSTTGGHLLAEDIDEPACWRSPTLDISSVGSSSLTVTFTIPTGSTWESSTTLGSIDFMDVEYSVDGGAFMTIANINGCPGSGHTISGSSCSNIVGPMTFMPTVSGLIGNTLDIRVCIDVNSASDDAFLEHISVPEVNTQVPVELISFTAQAKPEGVQLDWSTATEINNDYFQIERSTDGLRFSPINKTEGAFQSFETRNYDYLDVDFPNTPRLYYRLLQVDFDGTSTTSDVVVIENKVKVDRVKISPNPVDNLSGIQVASGLQGDLQIKVVGINGQAYIQKSIETDSGNWSLDTALLPPGSYVLVIQSTAQTLTKRFVKIEK